MTQKTAKDDREWMEDAVEQEVRVEHGVLAEPTTHKAGKLETNETPSSESKDS